MRYLWLIFAIAALSGGAWLGYAGEWWKAGVMDCAAESRG